MSVNVILMTFDALGYDLLEQNIDSLPSFKSLRDRSVSFRNAFSVGASTFFSFPAIIGSVYPFHFGVGISDGITTIDELLKSHGYSTAQINEANALISPYYGYSRATDYQRHFLQLSHAAVDRKLQGMFLGGARPGESPESLRWRGLLARSAVRIKATPPGRFARQCALWAYFLRLYLAGGGSESFDHRARLYGEFKREILRFIESSFTPPQFLFVHTIVNHLPYFPSRGSKAFSRRRLDYLNLRGLSNLVDRRTSRHLKTLYIESMQTADELLGDTLEALRRTGRLDDTLIIVSADHGEEFMEEGYFGHSVPSSSDRLLHVPLMFHCPRLLEPRSIDAPVSLTDILPTACDLLGYPVPDTARGVSLKPLFLAPAADPALSARFWQRPIFSEGWQTEGLLDRKSGAGSSEKVFTVRKGGHKLTVRRSRKHDAECDSVQEVHLSDWQAGVFLDTSTHRDLKDDLLRDLDEHLETEASFADSLRRKLEMQRLRKSAGTVRGISRT